MHVTECVFLGKRIIRDDESVYDFLSRDFGKISAWMKTSKKHLELDLWARVQASFETKLSNNRLSSIKLRSTLQVEGWSYESVLWFLRIITTLAKVLPDGVPNIRVFDTYESLLSILSSPGSEEDRRKTLTLFLLFLAETLWILPIPKDANPTWKKLVAATKLYSLSRLLTIEGIDQSLLDTSDEAINLAFHRYFQ